MHYTFQDLEFREPLQMKDTIRRVATFLQNSSKGKLKYDRFWLEEGRVECILKVNDELTKIHHASPSKSTEDNADRFQTSSPLHTKNKIDFSNILQNKIEDVSDKEDGFGKEADVPTPASAIHMCMKAYEEERNKKVKENICRRRNLVEQNTELNQQWAEQQIEHMKQKIQLEMQKKVNNLLLAREKELQDVKERQEKQKEHIKIKARRLSEGKRVAEARQRQLEELQQQKKREQLELRTRLVDIQKNYNEMVKNIMECLQANQDSKWLSVSLTDRSHKLKEIVDHMNSLLMKCQGAELDSKTVRQTELMLHEVETFLEDIKNDIELGNARRKEEECKEKEKLESNDVIPASNEKLEEKNNTTESSALYQYVSPSNLQHYVHIIEHQKTWQNKYKTIMEDVSLKKYRFDLQKAVNTPVNAISQVSGAHLRDKIRRLSALLSGETVTVGDKRVTCKSHPNGTDFCMDLLAKKLITQAETQVPSNNEAAFSLAGVAVSLLAKFPDLKPLMLAHFYLRCPYLVPYYIPRKDEQSQEDYYKSLGYLYVDGVVEKQDQFLKRMSGIVRFYGAVLLTAPMPELNASHPHGVSFGWKFLAAVLNLRPRADITATILFHFLDVAGNALYTAYGKQFRKLLHVLCKDYFHEIEQVTVDGSGGPLSRLQNFLQRTIRSGTIAPPQGALTPYFWNSR